MENSKVRRAIVVAHVVPRLTKFLLFHWRRLEHVTQPEVFSASIATHIRYLQSVFAVHDVRTDYRLGLFGVTRTGFAVPYDDGSGDT